MRITPQTKAVLKRLQEVGHATNLELLSALTPQFPDISATTIHRITKRLVGEGQISMLISPYDGSVILDANARPHYHFVCQACGKVKDIQLTSATIDDLQIAAGVALRTDNVIITGIKADCPALQQATV